MIARASPECQLTGVTSLYRGTVLRIHSQCSGWIWRKVNCKSLRKGLANIDSSATWVSAMSSYYHSLHRTCTVPGRSPFLCATMGIKQLALAVHCNFLPCPKRSGSMANQFCENLQGVGRFMKKKNCHLPYLHRLSRKPIWVSCVVSCYWWVDDSLLPACSCLFKTNASAVVSHKVALQKYSCSEDDLFEFLTWFCCSFVVDPVQLNSQPWLLASLWRSVLNKASAMCSRKAAFL